MGVTGVEVLKTKAVMTPYGANDKENEKCLNSISVISKLRGLSRAHNCREI